jgi:hypothetical protein
VRTMQMVWGNMGGPTQNPCAACGREMKEKVWAVHVIDGGARVLHPEDEAAYSPDSGEMGFHFVGPECRKKFGSFVRADLPTTIEGSK